MDANLMERLEKESLAISERSDGAAVIADLPDEFCQVEMIRFQSQEHEIIAQWPIDSVDLKMAMYTSACFHELCLVPVFKLTDDGLLVHESTITRIPKPASATVH